MTALDDDDNDDDSFGTFLESGAGQYTGPAAKHAEGLAEDFRRHRVTVHCWREVEQFMDDYPQYFRGITDADIAAGRKTTWQIFEDYRRWWRRHFLARMTPTILHSYDPP